MEHPGELTSRGGDSCRSHVLHAFHRAKGFYDGGVEEGRLIPYSCACERTNLLPESEVYNDEWQYQKRMHSSKSFRDYAVWYAAKFIDMGMGGIYVDNTFTGAKYTWPTGEAYIGDDGEIHPGLGLLSRTRQLIKRLATMMYEKGKEPFVYVHMTNANMLPMLSFAQANLGWEWKYGKADFQEKFTPGYIRAVDIGQQAGTIPVVLGGVTGFDAEKEKEEYVRVSRTSLAMTLPHHIFIYSRVDASTAIKVREIISEFIRRPDSNTYFYWNNEDIIRAPENLMVTFHKAGSELLFVIGNLKDAGEYKIDINLAKLGVSGIRQAINKETGEKVEFGGNTLKVNRGKHVKG